MLRQFLATEAGRNTAVVVNEFGEVGIDQALLGPGADKTVLLGNGCLCCVVRSGLDTTFRQLFADRARGAVPPFVRVVLETSGADDPSPILQTFLSERALGREYHLQSIVAVVDASRGTLSLRQPEARRQVAVADRIVLTKQDLAADAAPAAAIAEIRELNPHAPIRSAVHGQLPAEFLLEDSPLVPAHGALTADAGAAHTRDLTTFTLSFSEPVRWPVLAATLNLLADLRGDALLRVKGLVAVEGCQGPVVVQAVQHLLHPPMELEAWPDADRHSRLVFITTGLARAHVEALFDAVTRLTRR